MSLWQRLVGPRPIVTRLVLAVAVAMALVLVLAAGFVYWRVAYALDRQLGQDLAAWSSVVDRAVAAGEQPPGGTPGLTFQTYDRSGDLVGGNTSIPRLASHERLRALGRRVGDAKYDVGSLLPAAHRAYRAQVRVVTSPEGARVVVAAISRQKHDEALRELLLQLAIADLIALGAASFVGYRTARAALDPVEAYRRAAARPGAEELGRLPVAEDRDDELSRLGHTFNDLLERIESGAARERQFLADASHELRTPLALMSAELEWAGHRRRSEAEMGVVVTSLRDQLGRLVGLTNSLLELEEMRALAPLQRHAVRLRDLVEDAAKDALPRDHPARIEVPDVTVCVSGQWLTVAVANLLRNAVRHGAGRITLVATYDKPTLRLVVRDEGPGFPQEFRELAFGRFTRAEQSRTTPGSGLGLNLVRSVAVAHGGSVRILDGPGAAVEMVIDACGAASDTEGEHGA